MQNTLRSISALWKETNKKKEVQGFVGGLMTASLFVLLFFVILMIAMAAVTIEQNTFLAGNVSRTVIVGLIAGTAFFIWMLLTVIGRKLENCSEKSLWLLEKLLLAGMIILQLVFLLYYRSAYLFDTAFVSGAASSLALTGEVSQDAWYYMSIYPNQNAFAVFTFLLWKLCTWAGMTSAQIPLVLNGVNMIALDVSLFFTYLTLKEYKPDLSRAKRVLFLLFAAMNPFLYMGVSYYYTITLSMPFFMFVLYGFVRIMRRPSEGSLWFYIAWGAAFAIGYLFRATTIIVLIAGLFCLLAFKKIGKRQWIALFSLVLVLTAGGRMCEKVIGIDTTDTAFPTTHWLMMSMTSPGYHNAEDEQFTASFSTREEKKEAIAGRMREKAEALGAKGFADLAVAKMKATWADGTNGYTLFLEQCLNTGPGYEAIFGRHNDVAVIYHQAYWLLMLFLIARTVLGSILTGRREFYILQLTFLGAILFYLLWETGAQYSLPFFQTLTLLAYAGTEPDTQAGIEKLPTRSLRINKNLTGAAAVMCILFMTAFFIKYATLFTENEIEFAHPVVLQYLANHETEVKDGEELVQEFSTNQPFNRVLFQFRNDDSASDAIYEVQLVGEKSGTIAETKIVAEGQPASGGVFLEIPTVTPDGKEVFHIKIRKTTGSKEHNLRFVTYRMGAYDAYPSGELEIDGAETTQDLVYSVTHTKTETYTTTKRYSFFAFMAVLLYTITTLCLMEIWKCKKSQSSR